MRTSRIQAEIEGWFWQGSAPLRRGLRTLRANVARLRRWLRGQSPEKRTPSAAGKPAEWYALKAAGTPSELADLRLAGEFEGLDWIARDGGGDFLLRIPLPADERTSGVGRVVGDPAARPETDPASVLPWRVIDGRRILGDVPHLRTAWTRPDSLRSVAESGEKVPTAVLLLPFLAVGGAERLLLAYASAVSRTRRLVVVTTEPRNPQLGETREAIEAFAVVYALGESVDRAEHPRALRSILREHAADSLVCWNGCALFYDLAPRLKREIPGLRIVNQLYDHRVGWIRRLTPAMRRALDCTIAVNAPIAETLRSTYSYPKERVRLVRHGVGPAPPASSRERQDLRRTLGIPVDAVVAASFLRLHQQKRPLDLLEIAHRLSSTSLWLLLVGGGPLDEAIREQLARRPLANVVWLPLDPRPERLFAAADLCLMASEYEGLPIFLLEGMSRGLPAVSTDVGEVPALLEGGGGLTAPVGDLEGLSAAVRSLLDPERRVRAGEVARSTVATRYSLERFVSETDDAIFGSVPSR